MVALTQLVRALIGTFVIISWHAKTLLMSS